MQTQRTHIVVTRELTAQIDAVVGRRGRSGFFVKAALGELRRLKQLRALQNAAGAWQDKNHAELARGSSVWVTNLRKESDKRLKKLVKK